MRARFHLPEIDAEGHGVLVGDEAAHLTRVMRLGTGAEIDVFDGRGGMFLARVEGVARDEVRVRVVGPAPSAPEAAVRVTIVASVLKGDKMEDVVRDVTMMGVVAVQPVVAARSEVSLAALTRAHRVARWQRIAISAVKQCGRATVPVVHAPLRLGDWCARSRHEPVLVLTEPAAGGGPGPRDVSRTREVQLLVGPEGGWSPEEVVDFATSGFQPISLGGRTLRADAAPVVALAALYEAWQGW